MVTLDNGKLTVSVSEHGAELQNIQKNGHEYLWQGDPLYWGRRSPVLFPIVGRVYDDIYRYRGAEFALGQHGFARDMDFKLLEQTADRVVYALEDSDMTLEHYPCRFRLEIEYRLIGSSIEVLWRVENKDGEPMHFQIGAHPAFYLPDFDASQPQKGFFSFDGAKELKYTVPVGKGCTDGIEHDLALNKDGMMPIEAHTFDCDTYVFEKSQLKKITLHDRGGSPYVSLEFDTPVVALWSPTNARPDCPFVCIEPWYGRCDNYGYDGDFSCRDYMQTLAPGEKFSGSYLIVIE